MIAVVYVSLIIKKKKTYEQVPDNLKEQVKQILIDCNCEHLVTE